MVVPTKENTHSAVELRSVVSRAAYPQDYISDHGRLATNTVEGFHGLALLYRGKKTDLGHVHYTCKTNMAICHKVSYTFL